MIAQQVQQGLGMETGRFLRWESGIEDGRRVYILAVLFQVMVCLVGIAQVSWLTSECTKSAISSSEWDGDTMTFSGGSLHVVVSLVHNITVQVTTVSRTRRTTSCGFCLSCFQSFLCLCGLLEPCSPHSTRQTSHSYTPCADGHNPPLLC